MEVVAADGVLCDISQRLAANDLSVSCLLQANDDPHQFQLTPRQSRELRQARLVLINGYNLTPALRPGPNSLAVAELAVPDSPLLAQPDSHDHDHSPSDSHQHGDRDPHVWNDPRQAAAMVQLVSQRLQQLKPEAAAAISRRASAMGRSLEALHRWNQEQFSGLRNPRSLASSHRGFASLARAYGLTELALVDAGSSGASLRPQALAASLEQLRQLRPGRLFSEQLPASRALQRISSLSGIPVATEPLRADGLAPGSGGGSADLMTTLTGNTCLIVTSLGGHCNRQGQHQLIAGWQAIR